MHYSRYMHTALDTLMLYSRFHFPRDKLLKLESLSGEGGGKGEGWGEYGGW